MNAAYSSFFFVCHCITQNTKNDKYTSTTAPPGSCMPPPGSCTPPQRCLRVAACSFLPLHAPSSCCTLPKFSVQQHAEASEKLVVGGRLEKRFGGVENKKGIWRKDWHWHAHISRHPSTTLSVVLQGTEAGASVEPEWFRHLYYCWLYTYTIMSNFFWVDWLLK